MSITRRRILAGAGALAVASSKTQFAFGGAAVEGAEIDLTDDDTRGKLGELDLKVSGVQNVRAAMKNFIFPDNCDDGKLYGIDVSHHNGAIPWGELAGINVKYSYSKASQGVRGKDSMFAAHWNGAVGANIPTGAYHFLSAGVDGADQAKYYLKRLSEVGGLQPGGLQPVVDLEWDMLGPNFKKRDKDYWEDIASDQIHEIVQSFVDTVIAAHKNLKIVPLVYTNRSWWMPRMGSKAKIANCKIWISDYRKKSYDTQQPLSVPGHAYDLWQFSETGRLRIKKKLANKVDCNKLLPADLASITIQAI